MKMVIQATVKKTSAKKTWLVSDGVKASGNRVKFSSEAEAREEFEKRLKDGGYHTLATLDGAEWVWVEKGWANSLEVKK
jgi:hypothetical protein